MEFEKRSASEDEYFKRLEIERRKKWAEEQQAKMAAEEKDRLRELHHMKCPKCGMNLEELELYGVTIDRCMNCNGTWFDAGEIDTMVKQHDTGIFKRVMGAFKSS